jgi:hypothetical protein
VRNYRENSTLVLNARSLANELHWYINCDLLIILEGLEINVDNTTLEVILLNFLHDSGLPIERWNGALEGEHLRTTSLRSKRRELLKRNLNSERLLSLVVRDSWDESLSAATVCRRLTDAWTL